MKRQSSISFGIAFLVVVVILLFLSIAVKEPHEPELFVIERGATTSDIINKLYEEGFINTRWFFNVVLKLKGASDLIEPGGYEIAKDMSSWKIVEILTRDSEMKWVAVPEGLRKEEITELIGDELGWSKSDKKEFVNAYTEGSQVEGVYFPDSYLIPVDERSVEVAERMIRKFNEKLEPYLERFFEADIRWDTAVKLASLVQREAASKTDMPLVAGILWNRLLENMRLQVDATVQYARGETEEGWWAPIQIEDKEIDSPYNTYIYKGLPPMPIANPGIAAIEAVLNPEETDCLFYIHNNRQIYCSATYEEHKENIEKHLK